jgi:superkiller protein 3
VHLYGLICERLGLVDDAVVAFETAVSLLEQEFEHTESAEIEQRYAVALVNLGRARLADKQYAKAIEAFSGAWDLVQDSPKMRTQVRLGLAVAKFWTEDVDGCLEEFESALQEAESAEAGTKEAVVVLLARTLWGLGEDGKEVAKGHLLEW